jgi:uncharacterized protein involved in exopolysaccharide biosynthesis
MFYPATKLPPSTRDARVDLELWTFGAYLGVRWRVFALALGIAVPVVWIGSLLMSKKYSATASILIEPPAGNDPRGSTAVSPVYLESLKTYEHFASSDSLFAKAVEQLHLRNDYSGVPIETVKRKVLDVVKPRDTKVLQVTATLRNPIQAKQLAKYIALATVEMNRSLDRASVSDLAEGGDAVLSAAAKRVAEAQAARARAVVDEPVNALEAQVASGNELKAYLGRELSAARTEFAAYQSHFDGKQGPAYMDSETARQAASAARAQVEAISAQIATLIADLENKSNLLEQRKQRRDLIDKDLTVAQQQFDAAMTHKNELLESIAFRGERLELIDEGVVPQKPTSPNILLNVGGSAAACVLGCTLYLAASFARQRRLLLGSYSEGQ